MSLDIVTDPTADPYAHLPPLPIADRLPIPGYDTVPDAIETQRNKAGFQDLFGACRNGDLPAAEAWLEERASQSDHQPSPKDLEFALEEACHNLNISVVRRLLAEPGRYCLEKERTVRIHYRCFRRTFPALSSSQTKSHPQGILTSDSPQLLDLLKVFLDAGWHPNQLLGPPYKDRSGAQIQEVALHYPRCLRDQDILNLILKAGADPTIARRKKRAPHILGTPAPGVHRGSGDILELAVNFATPATVDLLLAHGASLKNTPALQSLVRRSRTVPTDWTNATPKPMPLLTKPDAVSNTTTASPSKPSLMPESPYPRSDERFTMAEHLLKVGADINAQHDVYRIISPMGMIAMPNYFYSTALSHAVLSSDWDYVRWLLQHSADPEVGKIEWYHNARLYCIKKSADAVQAEYKEIIQELRGTRSGSSITV